MTATEYTYLMLTLIVLFLIFSTKIILQEQKVKVKEPEILLLEGPVGRTAMWHIMSKSEANPVTDDQTIEAETSPTQHTQD
jgi:leucyl-tRNA synthetase